jgi:hypothetical protein
MENLTPPPTEVVTDLEFIFLGGTKLVHTLRERDSFEDVGTYYLLQWADAGEQARIYKTSLLQEGRRVRLVQKVDPNNAVQQVVADIKKREAAAQGAVGRGQASTGAAPVPPSTTVSFPEDLWARSPLTR